MVRFARMIVTFAMKLIEYYIMLAAAYAALTIDGTA